MRPEVIRGNVFVANLPPGFTDEQLAQLFDPYGIAIRAYLVRDRKTGQTRGHGLVQLAPERAVDTAIGAVRAHRIGHHRIDVRRADPSMVIVLPVLDRPRGNSRVGSLDRNGVRARAAWPLRG